MSLHAEKVARVAKALRDHPPGRPVSIKKRAVSHEVPKRNDLRRRDDKIDLSDLDEILEVDVAGRTCTAEPGVTFEALVARTLPLGLVPTVVPELPTITIGGAVAGCSLESMSFRYGGFHDSCLEYEIVTATGEVQVATPTNEHALLFQMVHGTFGTLGLLTRLKFRLVPARPFVRVEYRTHSTLAGYLAEIEARTAAGDFDFMDGIIHSRSKYVLSLGRFVDRAPYTNRYDWMKIYYQSTATRHEDFLRTRDYLFRYDNGVTNVHPKSFLGRLLLGPFLHSNEFLSLAERFPILVPEKDPTVTLDMFVPSSRTAEFMSWYDRAIGHYPLWCVPYRRVRTYEWIAKDYLAGLDDELFIDLAVYGLTPPPGRNVYKELEEALVRVQGLKTLISYNHYDERTFWTIWNRENFQAVKATTDPHGVLRDLWVKTCRTMMGLPDR